LRQEFRKDIEPLDPRSLVFLDEFGINTKMSRLYGRAQGGARAIGKVPGNYGQSTSVISTLGLRGVVATMSVDGSVDAQVFDAFIEKILVPKLKHGDVVLMDRLKVHLSRRIEQLISLANASIMLLPPYSPDFSPAENLISKVKEFLRCAGARSKRALNKALGLALETVTLEDIGGWFEHRGYQSTCI
jgi:transposase